MAGRRLPSPKRKTHRPPRSRAEHGHIQCCRSVHGQLPTVGVTSLAQRADGIYLQHIMIDALEKRLFEALKSVDAHGDVAPAHVHDPMTMLLRENVVRDNLVRWDDVRGRYVLTGTGRRRISQGTRAPGAVVSFRSRGVVGSRVLKRKSVNTSVKE